MPENSFSLNITKEEITELPRVEFPGVIKVVNTVAEMKKAVSILKKYNVLGFDTESKPTFRKGAPVHVSLIQISTDDICFLFRVRKIGDLTAMKEIMDSPDILKIGLSIHDDFTMLSHNYDFNPQNFIDIQHEVKRFNFKCLSLQKIFAILFSKKISKSQQLSNWDAQELTEPQMSYAAIDAWACIQIYRVLNSPDFHPEESDFCIFTDEENEATNI